MSIVGLNNWIARHVTLIFGSMWCAYAFLVLALCPLFKPEWMQTVAFISSGVIQLVALPVILVGTSVLSASSERRAKQDHEILKNLLVEIREFHIQMIEEKTHGNERTLDRSSDVKKQRKVLSKGKEGGNVNVSLRKKGISKRRYVGQGSRSS